jgi:hypothetical protein
MLGIIAHTRHIESALKRASSRVDFAKVAALTRTAQATAKFQSAETVRVFDRPVPFTVNAFFTRPATKARPIASVGIKDFSPGKGTPAAKYLRAQIEGGSRRQKRSERSIEAAGLLRGRSYWVPGSGVKLNAYGNVSGSLMVRILSDIRAQRDPYANRTARSVKRNRNYRAERYFVPEPGSQLAAKAEGVWVRRGASVQPALIFVSGVRYTKRFDFFGKGMQFARQWFPIEYARALGQGFGR